jgi:hypothetical protein
LVVEAEKEVLLKSLTAQREYVVGILAGLTDERISSKVSPRFAGRALEAFGAATMASSKNASRPECSPGALQL